MKFSLRYLFALTAVLAVIIAVRIQYQAWDSYWHYEIASLNLGNGYEMKIVASSSVMRGTRRKHTVWQVEKNGVKIPHDSFRFPFRHVSDVEFIKTKDKNFVCVFSKTDPEFFILGDLRNEIFANNCFFILDEPSWDRHWSPAIDEFIEIEPFLSKENILAGHRNISNQRVSD